MSTTNGGNGGAQAPQTPVGENPPQLNVLAQYIKDFSFENPLAPRGAPNQQQQPAINIQVGVNVNPLGQSDFEIVLKIEGKANVADNAVLFAFELQYGGVFRVQNVTEESLRPLLLIECPRLLFPFAREIIATTVSNGGFPPLMLDPVDFVGLYRQTMAQQSAGTPAQA